MLYTVSADALQGFRLMLDTPAQLFDRICRENGIDHLVTQPRSPTTTGKIERFHKTLRLELETRQVFKDITSAQEAVDEWVESYNAQRPHRWLDHVTPASRFKAGDTQLREPERNGDYWVSRKVTSNGMVYVGYQKMNVGQRNAGSACDKLSAAVGAIAQPLSRLLARLNGGHLVLLLL
jgi:hypothetical protein